MKRKSAIVVATLAFLLAIGAVAFAPYPPIATLREGSARLLRPMMRAADSASRAIASRARIFSFAGCGACDEERIARGVAEAKLARVMDENESLKKMLDLKRQSGPLLTPATVTLYNQEWDREWLIIDAGEEDGVRLGDIVIDERQFLVGEVAQVSAGSATIAIASNKGTTFSIALAPSGGEALAQGLGARAFGLELIPRETIVNLGDMVTRISKDNKKIPPIFAGRMVRVDGSTGDAFKRGSAVLLSHPERMERVMVFNVR